MKKAMPEAPLRMQGRAAALLCVVFFVLNIFPLQAQLAFSTPLKKYNIYQDRNARITLQVKNEKLQAILEKIEKKSRYVFVYSNDEINTNQKVTFSVKEKELSDVLSELLTPLRINFELVSDKIILKPVKSNAPLAAGSSGAVMTIEGPATARERADTLIEGRVLDDKGNGLSNVSVQLKGTTYGTMTNAQGRFSLRIPAERSNSILIFSSVGFLTQEIPVEGNQQLAVKLLSEAASMDEVVVVGYGTQKRISVTGSVDNVGRQAVEGRPVTTVSQALQGASPNLIIQQRNFEPGQGVNINIRGLGTLGDNTPLVVIDGIPGGDLNLINPNDIESVSVLKDAGTAAIYGSRSANGVLLVTTRKGKRNEKPTVTYNGIYGIQSPRVTYEPVHAWENAYYKNESLANSGLPPAFTPEQIRQFAARGDGDWRADNLVQDASQQTHNLSLSGGGANNTYLLSLGYMNQQNNFIGPDYGYKRYNIRFNQTYDLGKLKLSNVLSYAKLNNKDHSFNAGTLLVDAARVPLYYSFQDSAGNYLTNPVSAQFNPKAILEKGGYRRYNDDEVFANFTAEYAVYKDLKIRGVIGGNIRANQMFGRQMQLNFLPGGVYGDSREVQDENYKSLFTNVQLLAEYDKQIKQHAIKVLIGGANESFKDERSRMIRKFTDPQLGIPTSESEIDKGRSYSINGTIPENNRPATIETSINSVFGRVGYNFDEKYFIEGNFRYDGSSKFVKDNRWGFFPSVSAAWRLSEEPFMDFLRDKVGSLKIRGSYGVLGNQNVWAYQYQTSFVNYANAYAFGGSSVSGSRYALGNPDLTWEKAATFNIGFDASLLDRRLDLSFDYFNKTTRDILFKPEDIPSLFGVPVNDLPDYNVAKVKNKGWEIKATYNMPGKLIRQTFSVNLADNLNELLELTAGATERTVRKEEFEFLRRVGQPITVYYGYKRNGYFQTMDDVNKYPKFSGSTVVPGDIKFVDRNGDGTIDDQDKFILGNPFPRYTYGFTYTAAIKGFDLVLFIQGVGKRDAMIRGEQVEPFHFGYGGTMYTHQTDYWTPTNPNAKYPRLAEAGSASNTNNYRTGSDIYLFDASYVRLKNVQIGYTIPLAVTSKAGIKRARVYLTGQNLVTLTKLQFFDPEITEFNNNVSFDAGANSARAYFLPVFYGFGLDLTF